MAKVRPATAEDAPVAGALTERAYRVDGYLAVDPDDGYAHLLSDVARRMRDAVVLVAEEDGDVVGTVTLVYSGTPYTEIGQAGELEIRMLAVAPEYRRRGVAVDLMAAATEHAVSAGLTRIVLSTGAVMVPAQRLYERLGYRRLPERDWDPGGFPLLAYGQDL